MEHTPTPIIENENTMEAHNTISQKIEPDEVCNFDADIQRLMSLIVNSFYSNNDIFLRELVSNAVDATQKMKTLKTVGELDTNIKNLRVEVILNKEEKTITVRDNGIGMTDKELDKYINQIAFSGAEEFVNKYKDADINIDKNKTLVFKFRTI